jgi:hypothetical protein
MPILDLPIPAFQTGPLTEGLKELAEVVWIPIPRLCQLLGIVNVDAQVTRLTEDPRFTPSKFEVVDPTGRARPTWCMSVKDFPLWVSGLTLANLNPQVKDSIATIQTRAAEVIWEDFRTAILGLPPTPKEAVAKELPGVVWSPIPRLCEILGIAGVAAQIDRLKRLTGERGRKMLLRGPNGQVQDTRCMALKDFPLWVSGLEVDRLKPPVKPAIETLQTRAAEVIWEDFRVAIMGLPPTPTSRGSQSRGCAKSCGWSPEKSDRQTFR